MTGDAIVYRPLRTAADRSRVYRLLAGGGPGYRSPRLAGDETWSGLWNLTAADRVALAAAAATRPVSPQVIEVRALISPVGGRWSALGGRLVRELADAARAHGAERMVAAGASDVLRRLGFHPVAGEGGGWLALEL